MLEDYEKTWPEGFNSTISKKVETMAASCTFVKIGDSQLQCSCRMECGFVKLSQSSRGRPRLKFRGGMLVMQMPLS